METPTAKDFIAHNGLGFSDEGLALIAHYRALAKRNPAAPLTNVEVQTLGGQLCSEAFGEDFQIIRPMHRSEKGLVWADRNTGYLNEDGVTYSYLKHGVISVHDGQPDVIKASCTSGSQTCYYVFDRKTLTVIPDRTIIHTQEIGN
jgi:hypothetical protein